MALAINCTYEFFAKRNDRNSPAYVLVIPKPFSFVNKYQSQYRSQCHDKKHRPKCFPTYFTFRKIHLSPQKQRLEKSLLYNYNTEKNKNKEKNIP